MFTTIANLFGTKKTRQTGSKAKPRQLSLVGLEERCMLSGVPAAPSNFFVAAVSASQVDLSWKSSAGATSYQVDEWTGNAWKNIGSLNGNYTSGVVSGLTGGTNYYFDLGATNASGTSWTNYVGVSTEPTSAVGYSNAAGSLFGPNGPSYLDVNQGAAGDCWLAASLAEVAARAPSDIRNMFTYDGTRSVNGSSIGYYTVRFYDNGSPRYVTVDTELPYGGGYYNRTPNNVLWAALAEKAYVEANEDGYVGTSDEYQDSYAALNGGSPIWALEAITGKSAGSYNINPNDVASDWKAGYLIVLSTNKPNSTYIVGDHCYAVVAYNPSNSSTPFELYNPWGTTSSGWAPGHPNQILGLFWANGGFLSQNFVGEYAGVGAAQESAEHINVSPAAKQATSPIAVEPTSIDAIFVGQNPASLDQEPGESLGLFMNSIYIGDLDAFDGPVL